MMTQILFDSNLEMRLNEVPKNKLGYFICLGEKSLLNEGEIINLLKILFNWFEREKVKNIQFYNIKFYPLIREYLLYEIKKSNLDDINFANSFSVSTIYHSKIEVEKNTHENLFSSKLSKLVFDEESFSYNEYKNFSILLEKNYRLLKFEFEKGLIRLINSSFRDSPVAVHLKNIEFFLLRNQRGYENVKKAVYEILCIKKYTKNNLISNQPKEIVKMICQSVLETFGEKEWCLI